MPDTLESARHVKPFVYDSPNSKALHFSISEIQSRMQLKDPHALDLEYTRTMMGFLLFNPEPDDIVMIGLGGGSLAKFCHRYLPHSRIRVVEINPHVIALRDEFHVPPDDARLQVVRADGARQVREHTACCDVLMVDGFDSDGLPARLSSQGFYNDCFETLRPDGIMVVNLHNGHPSYPTHLTRIRRSFKDATLVVSEGALSNSIVIACKGDALDRVRPGVVRAPRCLERSAADQLLAAFALTTTALKSRLADRS
jgi:spermidine synthase